MTEVNSNNQASSQKLTTNTTVLSSDEHRVEEITAEILQQKRQVVYSFMEIGKLLDEARGRLKKEGQWLKWLETEVDISVRMAQRYIQLARAFPDATSVSHLGMTKALALLALPDAQREAFLNEQHEINGEQKKVEAMSVREIRTAIREQITPPEKLAEDATKSVGAIGEADTASQECSRVAKMLESLPHLSQVTRDRKISNTKLQSEAKSKLVGVESLVSDIESVNNQVDEILKFLEAHTTCAARNQIVDDLRSLHEKVQKCLKLADLEVQAN